MAIDTSIVGTRSEPFTTTAERGRLRFFAEVIGETDPIYTDLDHAHAAGHPDLPIPLTFLFCMEMDNPVKGSLVTMLGVDPRTILHGGQRFAYVKQAHAGEELTFWTEVTAVDSKKGGALEFVTRDTHVMRADEEVAILTGTIIVRVPQAGRQ